MKTLPDDSKARTNYPISGGCLAYFPAALAGVAKHSYIGGAKYNDGALLHLRYISNNHMDCVQRHLMDLQDLLAARERGQTLAAAYIFNFDKKKDELVSISIEEAILIECNALSWRSLAISQEMHEKLAGKPLAPAAVTVPPPPKELIVRGYKDGRLVAVIKAIREIGSLSLKDAHDLARGSLPFTVPVHSSCTYENARRLLLEASAIIE